MGKKSQQQQQKNAPASSGGAAAAKKLSAQRRNELNTLVDSLLKACLQPAATAAEQWTQYVNIQSVLERIQAIESVLKVKGGGGAASRSRSGTIEAFTKWITENGAKFDAVKISEFPGFDLGLEATKPVKKEELLVTVPRKVIMSEESLAVFLDMTFTTMFSTMPNVRLAFALLAEKISANSFWKPYLDVLPEKYPTVMYFSVNEMQELRGSNVLAAAIAQCKNIARQYAFIYKYAQASDGVKDRFTYDLYRWAVSTVMTRQNSIPKSQPADEQESDSIPALIPLWDMANHKDGVVTSAFNLELDQLESSALEDYQKGEQVFIYYGDRSNADLLVHNGFVYANNQHDSVNIKLGLSSSDELLSLRSKLLDLLKIAKTSEWKVLQSPDFISPELLAFVRVFNMNADQLTHWISSERAVDLLHIDCALETSLEMKTWAFLQTRLTLLLRSFPTKLEDDVAALASHHKGQAKLGHIKAMLLQYRILEKKILGDALDYANQRTKA